MFEYLGVLAWVLMPLISVAFDILPVGRSARRPVCDITAATPSIADFEVLVPIYGDVKYLENLDYLTEYGTRVVLCTTDEEDAQFNRDLELIASRRGMRIFRTHVPGRRTSGDRRSVAAPIRDRVVRDALATVKATYVVCIDADTITEQRLDLLVGALEANHLDVASVRLLPSNDGTLLARLQGHEYRMAMRMRRLYPWLVSGACHVARTSVHSAVMQRHSLYFQGNDAEFGMLSEAMGYNVGHIPFDVPTTVPDKFRPWWRQRFAWTGGEFRLYVVNIRLARRHPYFYFYGAVVVFLATPLRWMSVLSVSWSLLYVLAVYYACYLIVNWRTRNWALVALPFYSLVVTLILVPVGAWSYLRMAIAHKNYGIIRPGPKLPWQRNSVTVHAEMVDAVEAQELTVADLQSDLFAVGHDPGSMNGVFDQSTKRALIEWQQYLIGQGYDLGAAGPDGVFGPLTAAASCAEAPWLGLVDHRLSTDEWMDRFRRPLFRPRGGSVDRPEVDRSPVVAMVD